MGNRYRYAKLQVIYSVIMKLNRYFALHFFANDTHQNVVGRNSVESQIIKRIQEFSGNILIITVLKDKIHVYFFFFFFFF